MATTFEKPAADDPVYDAVRRMTEKYHGELNQYGVTVEILFARNPTRPPVSVGGKPGAAKVYQNSLRERVKGAADVEIMIDAAQWELMPDKMRDALIDHELEHLQLRFDDSDGSLKTDDVGRPLLTLKPHDWELWGFRSVVRRHGDYAIESVNAVKFMEGPDGQLVMEFTSRG